MRQGSGSHSFDVEENWAKLPAGVTLGYTHGVVIDPKDNVYIHNQSKDSVIALDREGKFLKSWGPEFAGGAHGMYLSKEDGVEYLYLADPNRHIVVKTTLDGKTIYTLEVPPLPNVYKTADLYKPTDTAVAPNGDVYVCDGYGQSWIHVYDKKGTWIRSWGGAGSEPGKMKCPHGIWIDTRKSTPRVYVADRGNNRLQIFSLVGEHLGFVTYDLRLPCCFYQYGTEQYIPDLHSRVTILDEHDRLITHIGDVPGAWTKAGWPNVAKEELKPGLFSSPHACALDSKGDLYVVEWIAVGRITKLRRVAH